MIRQIVANARLDTSEPDRPVDWAELGRRIRAAAERAVASPSIEEAAVDVRRRLLESVPRPLAAHRSRRIRELIGPEEPASRPDGMREAGQ